jgi:hypothetical protein
MVPEMIGRVGGMVIQDEKGWLGARGTSSTPPFRLAQTGKEGIASGREAGGVGGFVSDGDVN